MDYYDYTTISDYGYNSVNNETLGVLAGVGIVTWIITIAIGILVIVSMWKIFKKAGRNGWESIIPIYNIVVLLQICKIEVWQIIFFVIPFANIYISFKMYIELAKKFGKSSGFGVLTTFFPFICLPILAFDNSKYQDASNENDDNDNHSILDVDGAKVPNDSEAKDFSYGYEKEETIVMDPVEENISEESNSDED